MIFFFIMNFQRENSKKNNKKAVDKNKKFVYYRYTEKTKEEKIEKMKRTTNESLEVVKRENYTLVNKSSLLSLTKTVALCLLENINMNKKTEIEPI